MGISLAIMGLYRDDLSSAVIALPSDPAALLAGEQFLQVVSGNVVQGKLQLGADLGQVPEHITQLALEGFPFRGPISPDLSRKIFLIFPATSPASLASPRVGYTTGCPMGG